jgi:hypothetical protein
VAAPNQASGDVEGCEQGGGAVTLIVVAEPPSLCHWAAQPTLGALQGLDVGLFVDRQDHCILGRLQIERDDIGRLLRKTPTVFRGVRALTFRAEAASEWRNAVAAM